MNRVIPPRRNLARPPDPVKPVTHLQEKPADLKIPSLVPTTFPEVKEGYDPVALAILMDLAKAEGRAETEARFEAERLAVVEAREAEERVRQTLDEEKRRTEEEAREAEARPEELDFLDEGRDDEQRGAEEEARADLLAYLDEEEAREAEARADELDEEPDGSPRVGPDRSPSPTRDSRKCRNRRSRSPPSSPGKSSSPRSPSPRCSKSPPKHADTFTVYHSKKNIPKPEKYAALEQEFKAYLEEHGKEIIDKFLKENQFEVAIDFVTLRSRKKDLAYSICNQWRNKKLQAALTSIARQYLRDQFYKNNHLGVKFAADNKIDYKDIREQLEIRIAEALFSLPRMPNRVQSLKEFIEQNKSRPRKLFKSHRKYECEVPELNPRGRRVLQKVIDEVLGDHKAGRHYNGQFVLEDWDVFDGGASVANTKSFYSMEELAWETQLCFIRKDLKCVGSQILPAFALSKIEVQGVETSSQEEKAAPSEHLYPPYLHDLKTELACPMELEHDDHFGWYCEYISFHPALLCSKTRMSLLFGFYHVSVHLDYKSKTSSYGCVLGDRECFPKWTQLWYTPRRLSKIHDLLWKVFWNGNYPNEDLPTSEWHLMYNDDTAGNKLELIRHLLEHVFYYSKEWFKYKVMVKEEGQVQGENKFLTKLDQTIRSDDEADMFVSVHFPTFLPELIKLFFMHGKMHGEFGDYWKLYKAAREV